MIGGRRRAWTCRVNQKRDATTAMVMGNNNQGRNNQPISDGNEGGLHRG